MQSAEHPTKTRRIGLLHFVGAGDLFVGTQEMTDFKQAMQKLGYCEGVNVEYVERFGDRDRALTRQYADELVASRPDVICSFLTNANLALRDAIAQALSDVPVICWGTDLVESGLVDSYRRPGRNFTGFTYEPYNDWVKVRFLKMAVPGLRRLAHIYNPTYSPAPAVMRAVQDAAQAMGLEFVLTELLSVSDFESCISRLATESIDAVVVGPHAVFNTNGTVLGRMLLSARLPAVGNQVSITRAGGLATFASPKRRGWQLMAHVASQIFSGVAAADIPVNRSLRGPMSLNMQVAETLGLSLPASLIDEADNLLTLVSD